MKPWFLPIATCLLLLGCASPAPPPPAPEMLFRDAWFAPPTRPVDAADALALSPGMRRYLHEEIAPQLRRKGLREGLVEALYSRGQLRLEYDASHTRTAVEAFEARAGNCLSLVLMTAAIARELGLPMTFNAVGAEGGWRRSGDLAFFSGHINLSLGMRKPDPRIWRATEDAVIVDFLPRPAVAGQRSEPVPLSTVLAMYLNNRAAESLADGRIDDAYWWVREALRQAPDFVPAHNTLGVVYLRRGEPAQAERVLHQAALLAADNPSLLANRARALDQLGREAEAETLRGRLARLEPQAPLREQNLGIAALERGDPVAARLHFERELGRGGSNSGELHYWLALTHARLGDAAEARRLLGLAIVESVSRSDRAIYAGKLERLEAAGRAAR